jgi:hypothetical protein
MEIPAVIREFVDAISNADGERAGRFVSDDASFRLPGDRELPAGQAGAGAFAAKHAESDGRKASVVLVGAEPRSNHRWVASLRFSSRELGSDELLYEMTVGGMFTLRGERILALEAFPSYEEAVTATSD